MISCSSVVLYTVHISYFNSSVLHDNRTSWLIFFFNLMCYHSWQWQAGMFCTPASCLPLGMCIYSQKELFEIPISYYTTCSLLLSTLTLIMHCQHRHTFKADNPNGALETDTSVIWVDLLKAWKEIPTRSSYISNDYKLKTSCHLN